MGTGATPNVRPLSRGEYEQLVRAGAFDGERLELLGGVILVMSPQNAPHRWTVTWLARHLVLAVGDRAEVQVQCPLALSEEDEPEPDLAVVPVGDYRENLPDRALLVVEVADSSRAFDLGPKAAMYARCGVPEYWVVDLVERRVVVHTEPRPDGYAGLHTTREGLLPAGFPDVSIEVSALFP